MHLLTIKDTIEIKESVDKILKSTDLMQIKESLKQTYSILRKSIVSHDDLNN